MSGRVRSGQLVVYPSSTAVSHDQAHRALATALQVGALAAADLVDEYRLLVQPLVLRREQALFDQLLEARHLNLVDATPSPVASSYTFTDTSTPEMEDP